MGPDKLAIATPETGVWVMRRYPVQDDDPRGPYDRDRDRIVHCTAFHRLQHKTQVYLVHEGDFYRTRLTHTLEVAQIARTLARQLGLRESLAEAIALAHDLGHTPFGHAGEQALDEALKAAGDARGWDSNQHSLTVVDEFETMYPYVRGLNLTFATRQGVARHQTPFDRPVQGFDSHPQPTPECQVVNLADVIAYAGHDIQDALEVGLLDEEHVKTEPRLELWRKYWEKAEEELKASGSTSLWANEDRLRLLARRARRHLIHEVVLEVDRYSRQLMCDHGISDHDAVVRHPMPVIAFPPDLAQSLREMVEGYLMEEVYRSPLVERQNAKEKRILTRLFEELRKNPKLLPDWARRRWERAKEEDRAREIAYFLASLTDRGAIDLYSELFDPHERAIGHHLR